MRRSFIFVVLTIYTIFILMLQNYICHKINKFISAGASPRPTKLWHAHGDEYVMRTLRNIQPWWRTRNAGSYNLLSYTQKSLDLFWNWLWLSPWTLALSLCESGTLCRFAVGKLLGWRVLKARFFATLRMTNLNFRASLLRAWPAISVFNTYRNKKPHTSNAIKLRQSNM